MSRVWNRQAPVVLTWLLVVMLGLTVLVPLGASAQGVDRVQTGDAQPTQSMLEPPVGTETPIPTDVPAEENPDMPTETPVPTDEPAEETPVATETAVTTQTPVPTQTSERPEQPDASPTVADDSEFMAVGMTGASFDQSSYSGAVGGAVFVTLTVSMDGVTTGGTVTMNAPVFTSVSNVVAGSTGSTTCTVNAFTPAGPFWSGTFGATGVGICTYTITLVIDSIAPPGFGGSMFANIATAVPSASAFPDATITFSQSSLNNLTISANNPNPLPGEIVTITAQQFDPATLLGGGSMYGTIPAGTALVPGSSTATCGPPCTLPPLTTETASSVSAFFSPINGTPTTMTLTYQVTILPGTLPGTIIMFVGDGVVGAGQATGPASTSVTVAAPPVPPSLTVELSQTTAEPGETVTVTVTLSDPNPAAAFSLGSVGSFYPAGTTLVPNSSQLACASCGPSSPVTTPLAVDCTWIVPPGGVTSTTATLTYQVTIDAGVGPGTVLAFTGQARAPSNQQFLGGVTASLTVVAPVPPLTANDSTLTVPYAGSGDGTLTATGGTPPYEFGLLTPPAKGSVTIDPVSGAFTYTASPGQTGSDQFEFNVRDSSNPALADQGLVTITIGEPDALVAATLNIETMPMVLVSGNLTDQVTGGIPPYTFTLVTPPTQGVLTLNPDGTFTYIAHIDASGADSFTYTVTDSALVPVGAATTTTGTVNIIIAALPTPTPTEPMLTPSPTLEPGVTPTATSDDGVIGPGDPDGEETPVDPRSTETPDASDPGGDDDADDGPITTLPSTGAGDSGTSSILVLMLVTALGLLAAAAALTGRRRTR